MGDAERERVSFHPANTEKVIRRDEADARRGHIAPGCGDGPNQMRKK
jgi:hypothetical protein